MRLRVLEVEVGGIERPTFECSCGFNYRQSTRAQRERQEIERCAHDTRRQ
jgi:hypothetical protein